MREYNTTIINNVYNPNISSLWHSLRKKHYVQVILQCTAHENDPDKNYS